MPIWFGLQWKSNLSMPVCFPLTLSFPVLSFPLCLILVLWVVIYVFFFRALLLVYLACFTSWWWRGCFDSSGVQRRLAATLPFCFGAYVWSLASKTGWHLYCLYILCGKDRQEIPSESRLQLSGGTATTTSRVKESLGASYQQALSIYNSISVNQL